ncbi:TetR/AcrR family transcriptional regulator [Shimia biformata]|uniref:TetR/AcrR family transcriptional regulator n=1 Tax=Shimia biformata TaxID=1294299 RepID=UPI00194F7586|nr:TetR/AcrR family transcriptional regulator [Shimia biformata]
MQDQALQSTPLSDKQRTILEAAFGAFSQYGIRRTSMEDIARGANMSRAALYLHYRNKEDIYRSMTMAYYDEVAGSVAEALRAGGPADQALVRAFAAQTGEVMRIFLESPHADELMDAKHSQASDIIEAGEQRLAEVYGAWLAEEERARRVNLTRVGGDVDRFSCMMMAALHGQKLPRPSYDDYCATVRMLALTFGRAIMV